MKNMQTHIIEVSICRRLHMDASMIMRLHIIHMQSLHDTVYYMYTLSRCARS